MATFYTPRFAGMVTGTMLGSGVIFFASLLRRWAVKQFAPLFLLLALSAAAVLQKPIPPGLRQAEQAEHQGEQNIPPPANQPVKPSFAQVQHDADQLASLARDVPAEVSQLARGTRPKDLDQKLKEINKLSKRLRSNLSRM